MASRETVYTRRLRRPIDEHTRQAIHAEYLRRRHELPVETEFHWHGEAPRFSIRSRWATFHAGYTPEHLTVDAELSFAARALATDSHRRRAVALLDAIADSLGL
jgi:hypothetical protein